MGEYVFGFIKEKFKKIYTSVTKKLISLFTGSSFDEQFLKDLSTFLLSADTGVVTTQQIIKELTIAMQTATINTLEEAKQLLEKKLITIVTPASVTNFVPRIVLLVGINGSGKTSFIAKFAYLLKQKNKKILIVAADTFRAAAVEQLEIWTKRIGVELFQGNEGQDPASVVFDACAYFKQHEFDHLIIDTAGRLQTKINLMRELEKIGRIVTKQLPNEIMNTWLTIDSMLGQNSLSQAEIFHEATKVSGLVLTKLDGTGKGGIVFAIVQKLNIPLVYITFGENLNDIKPFDGPEYVRMLLYED